WWCGGRLLQQQVWGEVDVNGGGDMGMIAAVVATVVVVDPWCFDGGVGGDWPEVRISQLLAGYGSRRARDDDDDGDKVQRWCGWLPEVSPKNYSSGRKTWPDKREASEKI
nr:hypothetical protein [Tanacetum cinerariifolium]